MPRDVVAISERAENAGGPGTTAGPGYRAFLIGERFMTKGDPGAEASRISGAALATEHTKTHLQRSLSNQSDEAQDTWGKGHKNNPQAVL